MISLGKAVLSALVAVIVIVLVKASPCLKSLRFFGENSSSNLMLSAFNQLGFFHSGGIALIFNSGVLDITLKGFL